MSIDTPQSSDTNNSGSLPEKLLKEFTTANSSRANHYYDSRTGAPDSAVTNTGTETDVPTESPRHNPAGDPATTSQTAEQQPSHNESSDNSSTQSSFHSAESHESSGLTNNENAGATRSSADLQREPEVTEHGSQPPPLSQQYSRSDIDRIGVDPGPPPLSGVTNESGSGTYSNGQSNQFDARYSDTDSTNNASKLLVGGDSGLPGLIPDVGIYSSDSSVEQVAGNTGSSIEQNKSSQSNRQSASEQTGCDSNLSSSVGSDTSSAKETAAPSLSAASSPNDRPANKVSFLAETLASSNASSTTEASKLASASSSSGSTSVVAKQDVTGAAASVTSATSMDPNKGSSSYSEGPAMGLSSRSDTSGPGLSSRSESSGMGLSSRSETPATGSQQAVSGTASRSEDSATGLTSRPEVADTGKPVQTRTDATQNINSEPKDRIENSIKNTNANTSVDGTGATDSRRSSISLDDGKGITSARHGDTAGNAIDSNSGETRTDQTKNSIEIIADGGIVRQSDPATKTGDTKGFDGPARGTTIKSNQTVKPDKTADSSGTRRSNSMTTNSETSAQGGSDIAKTQFPNQTRGEQLIIPGTIIKKTDKKQDADSAQKDGRDDARNDSKNGLKAGAQTNAVKEAKQGTKYEDKTDAAHGAKAEAANDVKTAPAHGAKTEGTCDAHIESKNEPRTESKGIISVVANAIADGFANIRDKFSLVGRHDDNSLPGVESSNRVSHKNQNDPRVIAAARLIEEQTYKPEVGVVFNRSLRNQQSDTSTHLIYHGKGKLVDTDLAISNARLSGGLRAVLKNVYGDHRQAESRFVSLPGFKTMLIDSNPTRDLTRKDAKLMPVSGDGIFSPRTTAGTTVRLGKCIRKRSEQSTTDKIIVKKGMISGDLDTRRKISLEGTYLRNQKADKMETASLRQQLAQLKAMEAAAKKAEDNAKAGSKKDKRDQMRVSIFDGNGADADARDNSRKKANSSAQKSIEPEGPAIVMHATDSHQSLSAAKELASASSANPELGSRAAVTASPQDKNQSNTGGTVLQHDRRYIYYVRDGDTMRSIFEEQIPREAGNQPLFEFFVAMNESTVRLNSHLAPDGMTLLLRAGTEINLPTPRQIADLERQTS